MPSYDEKSGEPQPIEKPYTEIIRSDIKADPQFIADTGLPAKIVYYCPDCKKLVAPKRIGKQFRFSCQECQGNRVAFGTEDSVGHFYRIPGMKKDSNEKKKLES